jgi:hypothetical protein
MTPIGHWLFDLVIDSDILLIVAIIIIFLLLGVVYGLYRRLRDRQGSYNLEYPADFVERSSADQDMEDRWLGKHFK